MSIRILQGDCAEVMRTLADNSVDAVVTDPPYGLSFMGKRWDYDVPGVEVWAECLRVLKPGGYLLAFAGTRTQHRMACRIEDAGFEIRDMIAWVYGSGFPKSLDVSKAIDKVRDWSKVETLNQEIRRARAETGLTLAQIGVAMQAATGGQYGAWYHRGGHMFFETGRALPSRPEWEHLRQVLPISEEFQDVFEEAEREVVGVAGGSRIAIAPGQDNDRSATVLDITAPATDAARQWQGWGTALKPALEPITMARKPLRGTVAANVLEFGTGGLNIDGCRIGSEARPVMARTGTKVAPNAMAGSSTGATASGEVTALGRWPANLIHDGSDEVVRAFPSEAGAASRVRGTEASAASVGRITGERERVPGAFHGDTGSAARFFKECKWDENSGHPASDAASPSSSCATPTAAEAAATSTSDSSLPASPATRDCTGDCRSCIPTPSHAPAELWDSTDTTPTTATSCESSGSAPRATDASTSSARRERGEAAIDRGEGTRFHYCPKADRADRNEGLQDSGPQFKMGRLPHDAEKVNAAGKGNHHPTVKPTDLMRYLCRLVTPPGGLVLDPFMGSGSTLKAAELEGFSAIVIELDPAYIEIARRRIAADAPLFAEVES